MPFRSEFDDVGCWHIASFRCNVEFGRGHLLSGGSLLYLACLPLGWMSYREHERKARLAAVAENSAASETAADFNAAAGEPAPDTRPTRLN